jgi:hypothetical protein
VSNEEVQRERHAAGGNRVKSLSHPATLAAGGRPAKLHAPIEFAAEFSLTFLC